MKSVISITYVSMSLRPKCLQQLNQTRDQISYIDWRSTPVIMTLVPRVLQTEQIGKTGSESDTSKQAMHAYEYAAAYIPTN